MSVHRAIRPWVLVADVLVMTSLSLTALLLPAGEVGSAFAHSPLDGVSRADSGEGGA